MTTYSELVSAIFHGRPGEPFQCHGFDTDEVTDPPAIVWMGKDPAPTLKEIGKWAKEVTLEQERQAKCADAKAALTASDLWVIRHVEDGYSLTPERRAYRDELRTIVDEAPAADKPQDITLPDVPPFPEKPS